MFYGVKELEAIPVEKLLEDNDRLNVTVYNTRLVDHSVKDRFIGSSEIRLDSDDEDPNIKGSVSITELCKSLGDFMKSLKTDGITALLDKDSNKLLMRHLPRYEIDAGEIDLMILLNAEITTKRPLENKNYIRAYVPKFLWNKNHKQFYRSKFYVVNNPGKIVIWDEDFLKAFPA